MSIQKLKGTYDIFPDEVRKRQFIFREIRMILDRYNYSEILTPVFEKTELFVRGIGEETDIVSKEMYTFNDGEFTLRPEMTAPVIRSYLENSLYNESPLKKLYYICNMFRRERPQKGRYREFWQFGVEAIGSSDFLMDAEIIAISMEILKHFGIKNLVTKVNTIGSVKERANFLAKLQEYMNKYKSELSLDSQRRLEKNPLRLLDTKNEKEIEILQEAPILYDYLEQETKDNFKKLLLSLDSLKIRYEVDHSLVRGFDYYTATTFEVLSDSLGAQNAILGGGRYDLLVEQLGGKPTPAIGFACGIERLMMMMDSEADGGYKYPDENRLMLYIATYGDEAKEKAIGILQQLRDKGYKCDTDFLSRSIKSQMKEANRLNAEYVIVLGEDELKENKAIIKRMADGAEANIGLSTEEIINNLNT